MLFQGAGSLALVLSWSLVLMHQLTHFIAELGFVPVVAVGHKV